MSKGLQIDPSTYHTFIHTLLPVSLSLTCPQGYLAALSASSYSMVSMVQRFGPLMNEGGSVVSLTYNASNLTIPGYGGGMSSAKAVSPC